MTLGPDKVERLIARLRDTHPDLMVQMFTQGGCYQLWEILREIWPEAEAHYAWLEGHIYVKIANRFYDINGHHSKPPSQMVKVELHQKHKGAKTIAGKRPDRWKRRMKLMEDYSPPQGNVQDKLKEILERNKPVWENAILMDLPMKTTNQPFRYTRVADPIPVLYGETNWLRPSNKPIGAE